MSGEAANKLLIIHSVHLCLSCIDESQIGILHYIKLKLAICE